MLFPYSLQIFPEVFFLFSGNLRVSLGLPNLTGRIRNRLHYLSDRLGFPTSPAVSGTAYITSLTAISLDCGCKSRHFLHHHQMFYRLFFEVFFILTECQEVTISLFIHLRLFSIRCSQQIPIIYTGIAHENVKITTHKF